MSKYKCSNVLIIFLLLLLSSCEKEITINLNNTNPRFVIEGNISNVAGESVVRITKTQNFDENTPFPTISGALVTISDSLLNEIDTLKESSKAGIYSKLSLYGIEGRTYKLQVKIGNESYTSISTMPKRIVLDSLVQMPDLGGPKPPAGTPAARANVQLRPFFKNLSKTDKYYQYVISRNDTLMNKITARVDLGSIGLSIPYPLFIQAKKNDVLIINMQFIDKPAYDYLYGVSRNINQFSATPSNPNSNFSNGALGFFKAHTSQKTTLIVK